MKTELIAPEQGRCAEGPCQARGTPGAEAPLPGTGRAPRRCRWLCCLLGGCLFWGCGDSSGPESACEIRSLPVAGAPAGPTVTDVALEVQEGVGIVVLATATDPEGDEDLAGVTQSVGLFPDRLCTGAPIVLEDDLAGSGIEESFGTAVDFDIDRDLFDRIAQATEWPVEVTFRDASGNVTTGQVMARVILPTLTAWRRH